MITATVGTDDGVVEKRKPTKRATAAKRPRSVAPAVTKVGNKPAPAKKAPKGRKKADLPKPTLTREGSKTAAVLELLKRPGGATSKELIQATGWQAHSLRGFLSGTIRKKMGLKVMSAKNEGGERTYSIEA